MTEEMVRNICGPGVIAAMFMLCAFVIVKGK